MKFTYFKLVSRYESPFACMTFNSFHAASSAQKYSKSMTHFQSRLYMSKTVPQPLVSSEGYTPDCCVTSDEVPTARPSPSMIYLNMIRMNIWWPRAVVKVDDTAGGITAGIAAGCWTVGVTKTVTKNYSRQSGRSLFSEPFFHVCMYVSEYARTHEQALTLTATCYMHTDPS